jgi:magnesium chelatase family protein
MEFVAVLTRSCSVIAIMRYRKRISGPLLDRIDIHIEVPRVDYEKPADRRGVESSTTIRARVQGARERQLQRFAGTSLTCNAEMGPTEVREFCAVEPAADKLLKAAMQQLHLSARAYHRVLKLARTIADLAGSDGIAANHVAEAIQYRPRVGLS